MSTLSATKGPFDDVALADLLDALTQDKDFLTAVDAQLGLGQRGARQWLRRTSKLLREQTIERHPGERVERAVVALRLLDERDRH